MPRNAHRLQCPMPRTRPRASRSFISSGTVRPTGRRPLASSQHTHPPEEEEDRMIFHRTDRPTALLSKRPGYLSSCPCDGRVANSAPALAFPSCDGGAVWHVFRLSLLPSLPPHCTAVRRGVKRRNRCRQPRLVAPLNTATLTHPTPKPRPYMQ